MSSTPPPQSGRGFTPDAQPPAGGGQRKSLGPIIAVILALLAGVIIYASTRNSPNFQDEQVDQPAPMPTAESTTS